MNCDQMGEYLSALCDGQRIPRLAAEHIGICRKCRLDLDEYSAIGSELRRLSSLEEPEKLRVSYGKEPKSAKLAWWEKRTASMRIPRLAFALMLSAIILLSGGLVLVRARAGAATGSVLELLFQAPPRGKIAQCVITADGNRNSNHCNFSTGDDTGVLFLNARFIARNRDRAQVGIKAKYEFRATGGGASDSEAELKEVPEQLVLLEPEEKKEITVSGLGVVGFQGKYSDHIPALLYRPDETLDPRDDEFRVVSPVLIRDNGVLANRAGSSSIDSARDATLMFYVPGEGRYLISVLPFGGSVEGDSKWVRYVLPWTGTIICC